MKVKEKLHNLRVVMVSHVFVTGAFLDLETYLKAKVAKLLFIGHPFSFRHDIRSFYRQYKGGRLQKTRYAFPWRFPGAFWYIKDALYTFWWILESKEVFDLYIGADNFDGYLGLLLKRIGKVKDVIFYTIDYIPKRFTNPLLNALYHYFDRQCLYHCKIVWNISSNMAQARERFGNIQKEHCVSQIVVPQGVWHRRVPKLPLAKKDRYTIVFLGHIVERQGLDIVIAAMPQVLSVIPGAKLLIIGTGSYEEVLKSLVKKNRVEKHVTFTGYIESDGKIESILAKSTIAVAMYKPSPESLTYFADPGKIKNYLSAGLPIVLTDVPPIAKDLEREKCAIISKYHPSEVASAIILLLRSRKKLEIFYRNALSYASNFDYEEIYKNAFMQSL